MHPKRNQLRFNSLSIFSLIKCANFDCIRGKIANTLSSMSGTGYLRSWQEVSCTFITDSSGNCQTVSSEYIISNPEINIFPNPSSGLFILAIANEGTSELSTEVFNLKGQLIYRTQKEVITSNTLKEIDLRGAALGTYYNRVLLNDQTTTKKVSVLRTYGR